MVPGFLLSGPKTGYRLNAIAGKLLLFYNVGLNQIYPNLRKLEDAGHIEKEVVFQSGKPNKHMYSPTDQGRQYFKEKMPAPPEQTDINFPFLLRSIFFRFIEPGDIEKIFEDEIQSLEEQLGALESSRPSVVAEVDENGCFIYITALSVLNGLKEAYTGELQRRRASKES